MKVQVHMKPTSVIKANLGINPGGSAQRYFVKRCADYMKDFIPIRDGFLQREVIDYDNNLIIYNQPYAHYMYKGEIYGPNIPIKRNGVIVRWVSPKGKAKHPTGRPIDYSQSIARGHANAGPYWDQRMWSAKKDDIVKEVQKYIQGKGN